MELFRRLWPRRDPRPVPFPLDSAWSVLDQCGDGVLVVDVNGRVVTANQAAALLFERPVERLEATALRDLVSRASSEAVAAHERAAREAPAPQRYEVRVASRGGHRERVVAVSSAPVRAPQAAAAGGGGAAPLLGTVLTLRDITAERLAADDLARSETRYRHLFEGVSDAIMTFDSHGRFTTVNDAGEAISGYARGELIGRFFGPLLAFESLPRAIIEFRRALSGVAGRFNAVIVRKDGARRYITVDYACPQRSHEVICLIRDATEEKLLQQQLIQSEKMGAIGQLVSGVAHEINNPLASISAFAQLLVADETLGADQRHSAEVIREEARRAARIVHNLLTFARQHKVEKVLADLNKVVADTLELRAYELTARGIRVVREFDAVPPETMVDVYQVQQVLLNLITNAEQAMAEADRPVHQLTLRTHTLAEAVRIEVEDTGRGIPAESQALVFNPFFTTKPTGKGTGLGLSISLGIISEHAGRIWAENVAGGGCRFTVELPRTSPKRRLPAASGHTSPTPARGLRILVADDEAPIRDALERFLTSSGHSVVAVGSGSEVLWRGEGEEVFDVILLDIRMPDVSGKQIFERWCRERTELSERVVFITGDIVSADLQGFLKGTKRPYLSKPFEFESILGVLPRQRVA